MKIQHILLSGLLLFTACNDDDTTIVEVEANGQSELSLISCNILPDDVKQSGDLTWNSRRPAVLNLVETENPDIFCTQGMLWNQVLYLEQQLDNYGSVDYGTEGNDSRTGSHNTIFYRADKYEVVNQGSFWHTETGAYGYPWSTKDETYRLTAWAQLREKDTMVKFYVLTTVLNDGDLEVDLTARTKSVAYNLTRILKMFDDYGKGPVILAGDMNASYAQYDTRRASLDALYAWMNGARESAPETDAKPSYNALGAAPAGHALTPDNVFLRSAVAESFRTLDGNYGVPYISDHNPIYCKIKF